ncbi:hypothetical protein [Kribbella endophytica]
MAAVSLAAIGLAVVAGLVRSRSTVESSGVPADCTVSVEAYRADGQRLTYQYGVNRATTRIVAGDNLGWVPTGLVTIAGSGDDEAFTSQSLATHPTDGHLHLISRVGRRVGGVRKVTEQTVTRVGPGFAGTRLLTAADSHVYRVAGRTLYRYQLALAGGRHTISAPVKLSGDWGAVNTLKHQRTEGRRDVLIGTTSSGQLREWRVDHVTPAAITSTVLSETGWEAVTGLGIGVCDYPNSRLLLGITATGTASVDFATSHAAPEGDALGPLGWTAKTY